MFDGRAVEFDKPLRRLTYFRSRESVCGKIVASQGVIRQTVIFVPLSFAEGAEIDRALANYFCRIKALTRP
jgi:hypothetical protein